MPEHLERLRVCGTCFNLYGGELPRADLCQCFPAEERVELGEQCKQRNGGHWHKPAELCRCCGADIHETPTKYSVWFCRACLARARTVNEALGCCAVPVGWHSIVNGVFVKANRCKTLTGATGEADQLTAFFRESGSVWTRGLKVIAHQWERAGFPEGVSVPACDYLEAVWAVGVDKATLFEELLIDRGIPHDWRDYAAIPFTLSWTELEGGRRYEACDETVWTFPDGVDEYSDLCLTVFAEPDGTWSWTIAIEVEAAGTDCPIIESGNCATAKSARDECERTTSWLIEEQERKAGNE